MTEAEWLAGAAPLEMVKHLCDRHGAARRANGRRKLRLLACAAGRRVWDKLADERDRALVALSEGFADGLTTATELKTARARCLDRPGYVPAAVRAAIATSDPQPRQAAREALVCVCMAVASHGAGYGERWAAEAAALAGCVREVFGNPFRPARVEPAWLTWNDGALSRLARAIYEEGRFDSLPVLADALLDAGCDNEAILSHLRSAGPHVRGCWALDTILGKL